MLVLNPGVVRFAGAAWDGVESVVVDREAEREVMAWSDQGPHAVLADVPEQRVTIRVVRRLDRDDPDGPRPGDLGELVFFTSPTAGDAGRRKVSAQAVVRSVTHEVSASRGARRTVEFTAVSAAGGSDPITVAAPSGAEV